MELIELAEVVGVALQRRQAMLVTAESCTGGWVAQTITSVVGCSHWFERGFVTYTNVSKEEMLGVSPATLEQYGAVSEQTVQEMVAGALRHSHAQVALAVSGVAGPGGGTIEKPVGTVCHAWGSVDHPIVSKKVYFEGNRQAVREQAVAMALQGVLDLLNDA